MSEDRAGAIEAPDRARRRDGPWLAILALPFVALTVPAALVLAGPLQSNGWLPRLIVFWIAGAVLLGWLSGRHHTRTSPAEVGCWILLLGLVCSLAAAGLRPLLEEEATGVTRAALVMVPLTVVALGIAGTGNARRCDLLIYGIVAGTCFSAFLGMAQSVIPFDWQSVLRVPGMVARESGGMGLRGEFVRVKGAAAHPIEYGVLAGAVLPLTIHLARMAATPRGRVAGVVSTVLLLVAIPMSVSRSGVLTALVAVGLYAILLNTRQRLTVLILGVAGMAVFRAVLPGLLGTVRSIFLGASNDPSVTTRTDDYSEVNRLFESSPVVGQGLGTFRPQQYFFLDNQYLMSLIEGGVVLLVTTLAFIFLSVASARGAVKRAAGPADASRAHAVLCSVLAIGVSGTFFDLFSFAQVTVVLFVLIGVSGALWHEGVDRGRRLPLGAERFRRTWRPAEDAQATDVSR